MWTDLFAMIEDVRQYVRKTGKSVEPADDPYRRVLGYRSHDREWGIKLTDVRNSTLPPLSQEQHFIVEKFRTPGGRRELLAV
jgi:hypothetical protein